MISRKYFFSVEVEFKNELKSHTFITGIAVYRSWRPHPGLALDIVKDNVKKTLESIDIIRVLAFNRI